MNEKKSIIPEDMKLPNFLIIGAQKSATSWLVNQLKQHPEIFFPAFNREVHFFNDDTNYKKGLKWYSSHFNGVNKEKAIGEKTPEYLYHKKCAERIKKYIPQAKLIISLRNPIDRAYSAYWHRYRQGKIPYKTSFEDFLKQNLHIIKRGYYLDQIEIYLEHFEEDKIKIILYDDIKNNKSFVLKSVFGFLDVDENFEPKELLYGNNVGTKTNIVAYYIVNFFKKIFKVKKYSIIINFIVRIFTKKSFPPMKSKTRKSLYQVYYKHNKKLGEFLKQDLNKWT